MTIDKELFGPQGVDELEVFALESLVFSVQIALQRAMVEKGISAKHLAEKIGTSPARVSQIFSDRGPNLTLKSIAKIIAALGEDFEFVSKSDLLKKRPTSSARLYSLAADIGASSRWQEISAVNSNRKPETIAA